MDPAEITKRTNSVFVKEFELDSSALKPASSLYDELALDSLDTVDLVAALEREFGVSIDRQQDEGALRAMQTLQDVYDFISSKLPA
jgi:acyl carrier protein